MLLSQALDTVHKFTPKEFAALSDLLSPELIDECLMETGVVTLRNSAVVQARQRLGIDVIRKVFEKTRQL